MKTNLTYSFFRTLFLTFVIAISTHGLVAQTTHQVAVTDYKFTPSQLTITAGDKVVWTNSGAMGHNVDGLQTKFPTNPESFGNDVGLGWTYEHVFNTPGTYSYQCDPHAAFGMTGSVTVNPGTVVPLTLTVNFTSMNPHVGQDFWLAVIDQATKTEIGRVKQTAAASFSIVIPGIEAGKSYNVDFWADLNKNGVYDSPPADHAWRLTLNNVTGNQTLDFVHNINFTDIDWKTKLTVHFTAMTPHIGQTLTLYVRDASTTLDTVVIDKVPGAEFNMSSWMIEPTKSYTLDIWADHNNNDIYNAPPVDHAWRLLLANVKNDTIIDFVHNTNFFDISIPTASRILSGINGIRLYPNPANQYIELLVPSDYEKIGSFKIYTVTGKLLEEKIVSGNIESFRYDISKLNNGIYLMEIASGNHKDILKFIKK